MNRSIIKANEDIGLDGINLLQDIPIQSGEELDVSALFTIEASPDELVFIYPHSNDDVEAEDKFTATLVNNNNPSGNDLTKPVSWITADWDVRRPIVAIHVKIKTVPAGNNDFKARLKVFDRGVWFPASPIDIIELGTEQQFPAILASRVMVEIVTEENKGGYRNLVPSRANVTGITIKAASQPYDISVSIDNNPPFFQRPGPMRPDELVKVEGLVQAVNQFLSKRDGSTESKGNEDTDIPLILRSSVAGKVQLSGEITTVKVKRSLDGEGPTAQLPLPWDGEAVGQVAVGAKSKIKKVSFRVSAELTAERAHITPPKPLSTTHAHLCDAAHTAAQGFSPLPEDKPLAGLDIYLRPITSTVTGRLAIHPDLLRRPAEAPFGGAVFDIELKSENTTLMEPQWVSWQLPKPLKLSDGQWWAILTITEGEAHWYLSCGPPNGALGTMYRLDSGTWFPRKLRAKEKEKEPQTPWALTRIRVAAQEPPDLEVELRRGNASEPVSPNREGFVTLLEPLTLDTAAESNNGYDAPINQDMLEIVVISESSGVVTISDLEVRFSKQ